MACLNRSSGVQAIKRIRECDEAKVGQGQKEREKSMPRQHVANRYVAVQRHLRGDPVFSCLQRELTDEKKPARLSGLFEFGSSYWT